VSKKNLWHGWTVERIKKLKQQGKIYFDEKQLENVETKKQKRSKFGNTKKEVNGIVFASTKEATRYKVLLLQLKAGEIGLLRTQVAYELNEGGTHSLKYIADFVYMTKDGKTVVEDTKGFATRVYKKKRRMMKKIYGIKIYET
jgi:hypothetical protein